MLVSLRHWVESPGVPWMTLKYSCCSKIAPLEPAMSAEGVDRVMRAGRVEAAGAAQDGGKRYLIELYEENQESGQR